MTEFGGIQRSCYGRQTPAKPSVVLGSEMTVKKTVLVEGPVGAFELLVCLATPSPKGNRGIPALVWGAPGTGKTSFIESLGTPQRPVITLVASIHDPTDFSGIPVYREKDDAMRFAPPEWVTAFEATGAGVLFLDELTTAPPTVQAALLRVVLERTVGNHRLPAEVAVAAAANPVDLAAVGWELSPPLANRFVHIRWEMDAADYARYLSEGFPVARWLSVDGQEHARVCGRWKDAIAAFLQTGGTEYLHTEPADGEYAFASPRTWEYAACLLATVTCLGLFAEPPNFHVDSLTHEVVSRLLTGTIGRAAAVAFLNFVETLRIPPPEDVLRRRDTARVTPLPEDALWFFLSGCAAVLQEALDGAAKDDSNLGELVDFTEGFCCVCKKLEQLGKADLLVMPLRRLRSKGFFPNLLAVADAGGSGDRVRQLLKGTFDGSVLRDMFGMLE